MAPARGREGRFAASDPLPGLTAIGSRVAAELSDRAAGRLETRGEGCGVLSHFSELAPAPLVLP